MATRTWRAGNAGRYTDPANWFEGVAPGPGDTALITGSTPYFTDPQTVTLGDTISSQTIGFAAGAGTLLAAYLGNSAFAADTVLNVTGPGQTEFFAFFDNALSGTITVGTPDATGLWVVRPVDIGWGTAYTPTTTNHGLIAIGDGSQLRIYPYAGGLTPAGPLTDPGHADFANAGLITVAPGGALVDSGPTEDTGSYNSALINNGTIQVQGAAGKRTLAQLNANVAGSGAIVLDGGDAAQPNDTGLILTGNTAGQHIRLRNAGVVIQDALGLDRVTGGSLTFEDDRSFLYIKAQGGTFPVDQLSAVLPFGMPISGFRVGNRIAILRVVPFGDERYTPLWAQDHQQLTIQVTNSLHPETSSTLARFVLTGTYGPNDFQATSIQTAGTHEVDITTTNATPRA